MRIATRPPRRRELRLGGLSLAKRVGLEEAHSAGLLRPGTTFWPAPFSVSARPMMARAQPSGRVLVSGLAQLWPMENEAMADRLLALSGCLWLLVLVWLSCDWKIGWACIANWLCKHRRASARDVRIVNISL